MGGGPSIDRLIATFGVRSFLPKTVGVAQHLDSGRSNDHAGVTISSLPRRVHIYLLKSLSLAGLAGSKYKMQLWRISHRSDEISGIE